MAIERLHQMTKYGPSIALSYVFCNYKRFEEHEAGATLMRFLLRGVLGQRSFPAELRRVYKSSVTAKLELGLDDTVDLFRLISSRKRQIFLGGRCSRRAQAGSKGNADPNHYESRKKPLLEGMCSGKLEPRRDPTGEGHT